MRWKMVHTLWDWNPQASNYMQNALTIKLQEWDHFQLDTFL